MNDETPQGHTPTALEVWTEQANQRYDALIAQIPKTLKLKIHRVLPICLRSEQAGQTCAGASGLPMGA